MSQALLPPNFSHSRLARRLLKLVSAVFLIVSLAVTLIQLTFEASEERENMAHDINFTISNMQELITEKIWNIDPQGMVDTLNAIASNKYILGIKLINEQGETEHSVGQLPTTDTTLESPIKTKASFKSNPRQNDKFYQFSFPLHYKFENKSVYIGQLEVYSHESVVKEYLLNYLFRSLFITFGQLLVLSAIFYFIVLRLVTHPIWLLSNLLSQQHLNFPVPKVLMKSSEKMSSRKDEIGNLFANYLRMTQLLNSKNRQVLRHQKDLESRVEQRTQALQGALEELNQTSEIKSRFLANMSHEIRTPMNGIIGMTELLKNSRLDDEQQHYVATIQNAGRILTSIINDILDLSKIEAGKISLESIPFNLEELVDLCTTLFSHEAQQKSIRFNLFYDPNAPKYFQGDPTRINQIVLNLLNNAFKFTDSGTITLRIKLNSRTTDTADIEIQVEDTGVGISPENHATLFDTFTQADPSTTRTHGGTGLGLAICDRLAALMQGKITLESSLNQGSCFTTQLPLTIDKQVQPKEKQLSYLNKKTALLLATNGETRDILVQSLEDFHMDFRVVETTTELSNSLIDRKPDALILSQCLETKSIEDALMSIEPTRAPQIILTTRDKNELSQDISNDILSNISTLAQPFSRQNLYRALHEKFVGQQTPITPQPRKFANLKIIVAEDNIVNQMVIKGLLENLGVSPHICGNGQELIDQLSQADPDLILMDCEMPIMDGYEATKAIRKDNSSPYQKTPIIGLSAHALQEQIDFALSVGMDRYMSKPIQIKELINLLEATEKSLIDSADSY